MDAESDGLYQALIGRKIIVSREAFFDLKAPQVGKLGGKLDEIWIIWDKTTWKQLFQKYLLSHVRLVSLAGLYCHSFMLGRCVTPFCASAWVWGQIWCLWWQLGREEVCNGRPSCFPRHKYLPTLNKLPEILHENKVFGPCSVQFIFSSCSCGGGISFSLPKECPTKLWCFVQQKGANFHPVMDQGWAFKSPTEILVDQMQTLVEVTVTGWRGSKSLGEPERRFFWDRSANLQFDSQNNPTHFYHIYSHDCVMTVSCREFHGVLSLISLSLLLHRTILTTGLRSSKLPENFPGSWQSVSSGPRRPATQTAQPGVETCCDVQMVHGACGSHGRVGPMVAAECQQKLSETDRSRKWCKCPNMTSFFWRSQDRFLRMEQELCGKRIIPFHLNWCFSHWLP